MVRRAIHGCLLSRASVDVPYTPTYVTTSDGELTIGTQDIPFEASELPKTVPLDEYVCGYIPIKLVSGNIARVTISGEEVLKINNGIIERKGSGVVYIGKMYDDFSVTKNTENALIVSYQYPLNVTSVSLANQRLTYDLDAHTEANCAMEIFVGDRGEPVAVYATNGTPTWSYNASTATLTLNITHQGPTRIQVYWRFPRDFNEDAHVDIHDLFRIGRAYSATPLSSNWNETCDINGDEIIDEADLMIAMKEYGETQT